MNIIIEIEDFTDIIRENCIYVFYEGYPEILYSKMSNEYHGKVKLSGCSCMIFTGNEIEYVKG